MTDRVDDLGSLSFAVLQHKQAPLRAEDEGLS